MLGKTPIGVDVDGVVGDFVGYCLPVMSKRLGRALSEADWTSWHTDGFLPEATPVLDEILANDRCYREMKPYPGAQGDLARLFSAFEVHLLTAVPAHAATARFLWLLRHGVPHDGYVPCPTGEKVARATGLGMRAFVEDNAETAQAMADAGLVSVLIDRPWNRVPSSDVYRARDLLDATCFLMEHVR